MAHMSPAVRRAFPFADYIPADVLKSLSQSETCDRLVRSAELDRVSKRAATPGRQREITREIIAMMGAPPRATTERTVQQRIQKAMAVPDSFQASAMRRGAQQLLDSQPPAPRNPDAELIVKAIAGEDGLMACYDENGRIVGVCPESALVPCVLPSQVAKAQAVAKARGMKIAGYRVADETGTGPGVQARNTGPVRAGGTTGLGQPRNAPQRALPGDLPDRQVVKAAARARNEAALRDYARQLAASPSRPL